LEADLNVRLAAAERSKNELKDLVTRNEAILEEQKALTQKQKDEEDALKDARVEHLVLAFKGMKPEQAGQLINSMDDAVAVSILSAMPGSAAGKILAMVQPDKAARLIKSISERRIDPKTIIEEHQKAQAQQSRPAPAGGTPAPPSGS
jgi:flagellar motility protein MotE (MotC chaperone)